MDYDGTEQRQLTPNNSLSLTPAVSPSGDMFAFTSYSVDSRGRRRRPPDCGLLFEDQPAPHVHKPALFPRRDTRVCARR